MAKRRRKKRNGGLIAALILIICLALAVCAFLYFRYAPSKETADIEEYFTEASGDATAIGTPEEPDRALYAVINQTRYGASALQSGEEIYLDLSLVQAEISERFYWDANENLLIFTTPSTVVKTGVDSAAYYVSNAQQTAENIIVKMVDNRPYVSLGFIKNYADIEYAAYEDPSRVVLQSSWKTYSSAQLTKNTSVRLRGGVKSPVLTKVDADTTVRVLANLDDWTEVATEDGYRGYVQTKLLTETQQVTEARSFQAEEYTSISRDHTINLTWHQVTTTAANSNIESVLSSANGVNVISPTWFSLSDSAGNITSIASSDYVTYAHANGVEVWGLVSNLVNDVDTTAVLTHTTSRELLESKLIAAAIEYKLDGINIDLEAMSAQVGDSYIQFIREMSILCRNNNIVLSVDVPPTLPATSFYNRGEMAQVADYVIVMAYDEHYNGSEAGSVSSISWASDAVETMLEEVPAQKLIFGVPFYTRAWENINGAVQSYTYGMEDVQTLIAENGATVTWDDAAGQNYAQYEKDGATWQIWVEDATSMAERMQIMKNNQLAGVASWKVGFETADIWAVISGYVN